MIFLLNSAYYSSCITHNAVLNLHLSNQTICYGHIPGECSFESNYYWQWKSFFIVNNSLINLFKQYMTLTNKYVFIVTLPISQLWPVQPTGHLHWYEPWMLMHVPPLAQENCRHSLKSEIGRKHVSLYLHVQILSMNLVFNEETSIFSKYLKNM